MRLRVSGLLIALGALLVACGGGGRTGLPPGSVLPTAGAPAPTGATIGRVSVTLRIPPTSQQAQARKFKPDYVSPNTKSIAFAAIPYGSGNSTPTPQQIQVFPVTTPSPCAALAGGGETCTFSVQAPFGTDQFFAATFGVASPTPSQSTPLSTFVSGAISVASPGPAVTPLVFILNGVVNTVHVSVPSPDPSNSPNTQVLSLAGVATSAPLQITPYDATGYPIMTDTFENPIALTISPPDEGVGMVLNNPQCATSSSSNRRREQSGGSATVSIGCASDLGAVTVSYDGSVTQNAQDQIVDTFAITPSQQASASPAPATFVLASNVVSTPLYTGSVAYQGAYLQALPNNIVAYLLFNPSLTTALYGTFNATTGAMSTPVTLNGTEPTAFYTMSDGTLWVTDQANDALECYTPSGTLTSTLSLALTMTHPSSVAFDGATLWWAGYLGSTDFVSFQQLSSSCQQFSNYTTNGLLSDTIPDGSIFLAPLGGGGVAVEGGATGGFWTATTAGPSSQLNTTFSPGSGFGGGVAVDGTGTTYGAFNNACTLPCVQGVILKLAKGSSTLTPLVNAPPIHFGASAAFGPGGIAADRLAFADTTNQTLGIVVGPNAATPLPLLLTLPDASFSGGQSVAISPLGVPFATFFNGSTAAIDIAHALLTTTWSVPVTQLNTSNVLSIDERGDSGPFTLTPVGTPPSCYGGAIPVAGTDHDFKLIISGSGTCMVQLQISDKNRRSQTVTVTGRFTALP